VNETEGDDDPMDAGDDEDDGSICVVVVTQLPPMLPCMAARQEITEEAEVE